MLVIFVPYVGVGRCYVINSVVIRSRLSLFRLEVSGHCQPLPGVLLLLSGPLSQVACKLMTTTMNCYIRLTVSKPTAALFPNFYRFGEIE